MKDLIKAIEDRGYRLTAPRMRVLASVGGMSGNFTAEEICADVVRVGRATVYRTLKLLVESGLVCKLTLQDGSQRYSFAMTGHQHHLVCITCGAIKEFRQSMIEHVLSQIEAPEAGVVVGHRIEVYVLCPSCQNKSGKLS